MCVQTCRVQEAGRCPPITGFTGSIRGGFCQAPSGQLSLPRRPQVPRKVVRLTRVRPARRCSPLTVRQIDRLTGRRQRKADCDRRDGAERRRDGTWPACLSDRPGWRFQLLDRGDIERGPTCSRLFAFKLFIRQADPSLGPGVLQQPPFWETQHARALRHTCTNPPPKPLIIASLKRPCRDASGKCPAALRDRRKMCITDKLELFRQPRARTR